MRWRILVLAVLLFSPGLFGHGTQGHSGPTYRVTPVNEIEENQKSLRLEVLDSNTDMPVAARFTLIVDGEIFVPPFLGKHGLRFEAIHQGKKQLFTVTYARGSGILEVPLPEGAGSGVVYVTKGYEYLPAEIPFQMTGRTANVVVRLSRWSNLRDSGWFPADEHVHFERSDPDLDRDWLTMLDADDLTHAHFLVLKGGNLPGVWASQFAYGERGEGADGKRLIRPGEEYRDSRQGHINLLGVEEIIQPITTGGAGESAIMFNYPPLLDVLTRARAAGGIGGPAHGTSLGVSPTGLVDTILGGVDFIEIANTHIYFLDVWYRLMNCGFITPPAAGTDLPNYPHRDHWQPLLGETRMYVRLGGDHSFESWAEAVKRGEIFVSSGPMIEFTVNGVGPGGIVRLPETGGEVSVRAELSSPLELYDLELVSNSESIAMACEPSVDRNVNHLVLEKSLGITRSSWLAARGQGTLKAALAETAGTRLRSFAHTAPIQVLVGDKPVLVEEDALWVIAKLKEQKKHYEFEGRYRNANERNQVLRLFERAVSKVQRLNVN